jgi:hypothetical protein
VLTLDNKIRAWQVLYLGRDNKVRDDIVDYIYIAGFFSEQGRQGTGYKNPDPIELKKKNSKRGSSTKKNEERRRYATLRERES